MLGIPHANLHNAANDAYYTLLASFALCDPVQRQQLNLDCFMRDLTPVSKSRAKLEKRSEKFIHRVRVETSLPRFADFRDSVLVFNDEIQLRSEEYNGNDEAVPTAGESEKQPNDVTTKEGVATKESSE
ncbi:hypothetical protein DND58_29880 [Pseudomonas syringae pv. pisi]|nr:hypothetical protein DND58_29880 [Pseudomonas syringae pv. pisi]